jgi:hypothetical protein
MAIVPRILPPVFPNVGIEVHFRRKLFELLREMQNSIVYWLRAAYRANQPELAQDESPAASLRRTMRGLSKRWTSRFDVAAQELADYFATAVQDRTDKAMAQILRDGGISVRFQMGRAANDAYRALIGEQVSLIKSIGQQHLTAVEGHVMRAVQTGRDWKGLTDALEQSFGVTRRRAAFVAKDQINKATAIVTRVRQQEVGMTEAVWLHSGGGNHPREEHVKWSGSKYSISKGMWSEVDQAWVWPGTPVNCRCISKSIMPF